MMKLTRERIKQLVTEAMRNLDFRQFHDEDGKEGVYGAQDAADHYGSLDIEENVLDFLDNLKLRYVRNGNREMGNAIGVAADALEQGKLELADKLLVSIFEKGEQERAVYHAIAYVRDKLEK